MKKALRTALAILLIVTCLIPAALAETYTVYVSSSGGTLNLREGPGTEYGIAGQVQHGEKVELLSLGSEWSRVKHVLSGVTGYIKNIYFDGTKESEDPGSGTQYTVYVSTSGGSLNLREGPGTEYGIAGQVQHGEKIVVVSLGSTWSKVKHVKTGTVGYIKNMYFDGTKEKEDKTAQYTVYVSSSGGSLNLREGPGTEYGVAGQIQHGDKVEVLSLGTSWSKVKHVKTGDTGYIKNIYFDGTKKKESESGGSKYTVYVSKSGGTLNLREGPGVGYGIEDYVIHGDTIEVLSLGSEWSKVKVLRSGRTGYIKNIYFDGTKQKQEVDPIPTTNATVYVKSGLNLRVRSEANTYSQILGLLSNGMKVTVNYRSGDWSNIYSSYLGKTGWVMTKYIDGSGGGGGSVSGKSVYHVSGSEVNIRTGAGTGYSVKRSLSRGTPFRVTGSSGNWYEIVTLKTGYTGWISKNYSASGATARTTANLNMRSGAGSSYSWIQTIPSGKSVSVSSVSGNWVYVTYNGKGGYVSLNYLTF